MQLFDSENGRCQVSVPLVDYLVELYLEVHTVLLLHVYDEVDARDEHE
jgi:hypothetical protein